MKTFVFFLSFFMVFFFSVPISAENQPSFIIDAGHGGTDGGGCVTRVRNLPLLSQNGKIFFIQRELGLLPTGGRPISQSNPLEKLYEARLPLYRAFADAEIENMATISDAAARISEVYNEISGD